jgi:hypothetical protein
LKNPKIPVKKPISSNSNPTNPEKRLPLRSGAINNIPPVSKRKIAKTITSILVLFPINTARRIKTNKLINETGIIVILNTP